MKRDKLLYSLLVAGSFFFTPKGLTWDMGLPKFYYASILLSIIFIFEATDILRSKRNLIIPVYFLPLLAFGIYAVVSTLFIDITEVILSSLGFAAILLVFISFSLMISKKNISFILWLLQLFVFSGMIIAIDALTSFYTGKSLLWGNEFSGAMSRGNISSLIGNVNFTTDLMGMLLPFTAFLATSKRKLWKYDRLRKIVFSIAFSLFLSVVMAGQTRGVYIALFGVLVLIAMGITLARLKGVRILNAFHVSALVFIVVLTVLLIIGYSTDSPFTKGAFQITERISNIPGDRTSIDVRMLQWKAAIKQWNSRKLTGTGFGTYKFYSSENMSRVVSDEPKYMYVNGLLSIRAHNEFIQILAETGILGISLIVLSLLGFVWFFFKNIFSQEEPEKLMLFLVSTASLVVIVLHSVVSFPSHLMPNALIAVLALGIATSNELRGFKSFNIVIRGKFSRAFVILLMISIPLAGTVLMSRNYFFEAYFTKGYLDKLRFDAASAVIPDLRNSIGKIKADILDLENFQGQFSAFATGTYLESNLPAYKSSYPKAPEPFLLELINKKRLETVQSIEQELRRNLKKAADSLTEAQNQGNDSFYSALYNLKSALSFEDHSGLPKTYLALLMTTGSWVEDLSLRLFNLPDPMEQLNNFFNGTNGYNEFINLEEPRALVKPLLVEKRHLPLKELPELIKSYSTEASLTRILKDMDISLLFGFQSIFDSIDMAIAGLHIVPDPKVFRFVANQYFNAFSKSFSVLKELDKLKTHLYTASRNAIEDLKSKIASIPDKYREQYEYLYDTAIALNPGGWNINPDWENVYSTYMRQLLLIYGNGAIEKCIEVAQKELKACEVMKETHWGIPDMSFEVLIAFADATGDSELKSKILALYEPAYLWNKRLVDSFYDEKIKHLDENSDIRQRYLNALERMKVFIRKYESKKTGDNPRFF
ncbi:hypothetical protein AT15_07285 [Kosmotoga arenicorallina S304]|uniref:O-antigen ligase-related domain-containing protein n=1 Tax=Kosmotoga arenicorallina S304 TaxID=1453497 RepID=A0A176K2T5_9BACT|nr:O-antigen ligase [Kosmotoga arenicorallina]OAA31292.1 hypothetical protein AT15_07285 [Kosmotoga arenicorallina S304]